MVTGLPPAGRRQPDQPIAVSVRRYWASTRAGRGGLPGWVVGPTGRAAGLLGLAGIARRAGRVRPRRWRIA